MPSFLTGQLWKIATGGAVVVALLLVGLLTKSYVDNRELIRDRTELSTRIEDPHTGYVALLAQARTNVATLQGDVDRQNAAIAALNKKSEEALAKSTAQLAASQAEKAQLQKRLASFLATGPKGDTLEDRIRDIDARVMSELVQ